MLLWIWFPWQKNEGTLIWNLKDHIKSSASTFTQQCNSLYAINCGFFFSISYLIISTLMWSLRPGTWVTAFDQRCLNTNRTCTCVYTFGLKNNVGIILNSKKLRLISCINYSSVQPVSVIAFILSAEVRVDVEAVWVCAQQEMIHLSWVDLGEWVSKNLYTIFKMWF